MTDRKRNPLTLLGMIAVFLVLFWLPVGSGRFVRGLIEAMHLVRWYAREHVLLCLVPAFFIAGAIGVFISQGSVMKYLGPKANKLLAYGVASVSGSVLAVCSCTVLPLFAGIWRMGAGLGPATAFLYAGPAINVLAIILTARILGPELGLARAIGAVGFSVIIGAIMHLIYRKEESARAAGGLATPTDESARPLWQNTVFFALMVGVLVFANWGAPSDLHFTTVDGEQFRGQVIQAPFDPDQPDATYTIRLADPAPSGPVEVRLTAEEIAERKPVAGAWTAIWRHRWLISAGFGAALGVVLVVWVGAAWWKVALAAVAPAVLGLSLPTGGLWVLVPFSAAVAGLSVVLATSRGEGEKWLDATWTFAKQILPLLLIGVLVAGFLLGRPDRPGLIPARYVQMLVGESPETMLAVTGWGGGTFERVARAGWPIWTNLFASVFGALMYFATLTEVPILQGLIGAGMGKGPALALLLAGPALSLPNMLVIRSVMGTRKTVVFCLLVVTMATISGIIFGAIV